MSGNGADISQSSGSWDTYWRGSENTGAYSAGGTSHPVIVAFWQEFFGSVSANHEPHNIVDIASGSGAILDNAVQVFGEELPDFTCVDISESAIRSIRERYPAITGITADARDIPLPSAEFTIATSQFGLEYAGLDAIDEALRLIATPGSLALLIHHQQGGIYRQCNASLAAVRQMIAAKFIPLTIATFEEAFEVCRGADPAKYEAAAKQLMPAIRAMEEIMRQHGQHVADGTILRLYQDVRNIHGRIQNYDPGEVLGWLRGMQGEVEAYAGRMQSMCDAAVDAAAFDTLCDTVASEGFVIERRDPLIVPGRDEPLAWALVAQRS